MRDLELFVFTILVLSFILTLFFNAGFFPLFVLAMIAFLFMRYRRL